MEILDKYLELRQDIFNYFGFVEDWVVPPIDDRREYFWQIVGTETDGNVQYAEDKTGIEEDAGEYFEDRIYTCRFYKKWVYRGEGYTMIMVDTHTDGSIFLAIFSNEKEL